MKTLSLTLLLAICASTFIAQPYVRITGFEHQRPITPAPEESDSLNAMAEIKKFQKTLNKEYKDKATSPLPAKALKKFKGHQFFPIDLRYHVEARLTVTEGTPYFGMKTTTQRLAMERIYGYITFSLFDREYKLPVYQSRDLLQKPEYVDHLFFPFTDETNGTSTYSGGRYIDLRIPKEGGIVIVDFNMAYNPYCAYSPNYSCPIVPAENHIDAQVRAGIKHRH